jgi:lipopolysaccharide transport system ATP-binding protein
MSSEFSVEVDQVVKIYPIFSKPYDRLKQMVVGSRKKYYREFRALDAVSFKIPRGSTFGLLGQNGSGKSTILQIIAGILQPTSGAIRANGRIAALLELGAGFNPEFTGRENVFLNSALLGITTGEVTAILPQIEEFADIGDFIDQPVKTYSSGMFARLAFAVASSVRPEILIVDEILAVGDAKFQARCFKRLRELQDLGTTIILVTHSVEQIITHCSHAVVLDRGRVHFDGSAKSAANVYLDLLFGAEKKEKKVLDSSEKKPITTPLRTNQVTDLRLKDRPYYNPYEYRWGDGKAEILDVEISREGSSGDGIIPSGDTTEFRLLVQFKQPIMRPIFGFTVKTKDGTAVFGSNSEIHNQDNLISDVVEGEIVEVLFKLQMSLIAGDYFISFGVASAISGEVVPHDRRYDSVHIQIIDSRGFYGLVNMPFEMSRRSIISE